jgi:chromosome partitioning protein
MVNHPTEQPVDMPTIAIVSQKGGAGKTTLAIHLAAAAQAAGRVALIVDTDPQATASQWGQWRKGRAPEVIDCGAPTLLAKKISQATELGAELIVIDTPPHADIMAREACRVADLLLVPCRPRTFDLSAVRTTAELAKASGRPAFAVFMAGPPKAAVLYAEAAEVIKDVGLQIAPAMLPERGDFHHSTGAGQTALEFAPKGKAAADVVALWRWIEQQVAWTTGQPLDQTTRKPKGRGK